MHITCNKEKDSASTLPTFVAKDLHRLPPVYFDHVDATSLLKDILILKQDLLRIKTDYVTKATCNDLDQKITELRQTVDDLQAEKPEADLITSIIEPEKLKNRDISANIQHKKSEGNKRKRRKRLAADDAAPAGAVAHARDTRRFPPLPSGSADPRTATRTPPTPPNVNKKPTAPTAYERRSSTPLPNCDININFDDTIVDPESDNDGFRTIISRKKKNRNTKKKARQGRLSL
ncbi:hypothetical protein O0L34_g4802 [Tuta absoluta]|nr:hypothetical protein O0L34_g4802 [Tuta absoluta]